MKDQLIHAASNPAVAAPPVGVAGLTFMGAPISEWVQVLAAIWLIVQIGCKLYDQYRKHKDK